MRTDFGFVRVAAAVPVSHLGSPSAVVDGMLKLYERAVQDGVQLITFPELQLAGGYSYANLHNEELVRDSALDALWAFIAGAQQIDRRLKRRTIAVVGLPLVVDGGLFNVAAVVQPSNDEQKILAIYVKSNLAGSHQFREGKYFQPASSLRSREVVLLGERVPIGTDIVVTVRDSTSLGPVLFTFAVEICQDLFMPIPPSSHHAQAGALIICNPSASNDLIGKDAYRVSLVQNQAARTYTAYVYTSVGSGESSGEVVYSGRALIAEAGKIVAQSEAEGVDRFVGGSKLIMTDVDVAWLERERSINGDFGHAVGEDARPYRSVETSMRALNVGEKFLRTVNPTPFVPTDPATLDRHCRETIELQVAGLVRRLQHMRDRFRRDVIDVYIGVSGGLDSAHALTIARLAYDYLKWPRAHIHAYMMAGYGTDERTHRNALLLCRLLGVSFEEHNVDDLADLVLAKLGHEPHKTTRCLTCQNVQARLRTLLLMTGGFMIGTGDFSEAFKNYCTYGGDDRGMYNVNASVAKTLIQFLVGWHAERATFGTAASAVLVDIGATPISAGLVQGQRTEDEIGPYTFGDFVAQNFRRNGFRPAKIVFLARHAFAGKLTLAEICKWMRDSYERVFDAQYKINTAPDSPKVGSVSWSHHTDWYAPSDMAATMWLRDIDQIEGEFARAEQRD
ncbi:MAG: NAD(+) synthase [bacterium]|nr:NAD(+) synthase [bacterium]